jgi:hypothetical protein
VGQGERLGRLPWKTLGVADLRDGYGERLWYAVSTKYKGLLNCAASRACLDMTPGTALGTITVRDSAGAILHDGTIADPFRADAGGAVAVVIAPGPALARSGGDAQARGCAPGECDGAGRCITDPPQLAAHCNPASFLDKAAGARFADEDNADFTDRSDAAARPRNVNGFIQGPVLAGDGRVMVNDRLAVITYRDVMPRVMARVALEVAHCLRQYASRPENRGRLPWSTPACAQADGSWDGQRGVRFGRIPDTAFADAPANAMLDRWWRATPRAAENLAELPTSNDACRIAIAPADPGPQRSAAPGTPAAEGNTAGRDANSWWTPWKPYVFYALAAGYAPSMGTPSCTGRACLDLADTSGRAIGTQREFAVIVAGPPLARDGFAQSRAGSGIGDPRQWLEEANARLESAAGCTPAPAFPCEGLHTCDRVTTGGGARRFNDVVLTYP